MKRVLIVTGGRTDKDFAEDVFREYAPELVIAADSGMKTVKELNVVPDYAVGDFDSSDEDLLAYFEAQFEKEGKPIIRTFNAEKDETDTELAISMAIALNPSEILLLGATGTRLDHTFANIHLMCKALESEIKIRIIDKYNAISVHDRKVVLKKDRAFGEFFSVLPLTEQIKGLSIKGAKYEIENCNLSYGSSLCISNEFAKDTVSISFKEGKLVLFMTSDTGIKIRGNI